MFSDLGGSASASASASASEAEPPPRMACALCRRRKLRCNRQLPCDSCTRLGFDCLYSEPSRTPPATRRPRTLPPDGRTGAADGHVRAATRKGPLHAPGAAWSADHLTPEAMAELEQSYFRSLHQSLPMLHRLRYGLAVVSEPRLRPPSYLRYIVCALGAAVASPSLLPPQADHGGLYRAARRALEEAELNDASLDAIPLARPQAWILIAVYELLQMHAQRWWMSAARAVRLCQMLGLHTIDAAPPARRPSHVARDWAELEEQRRTFWTAFLLDRYAAFGFASPMLIDEGDVHVLLPVSEDAYEGSTEAETTTLNDVLCVKNTASLPPMAAAIVLTAETGRKLKRLRQETFTTAAAAAGRGGRDDFWDKIHFLDDTLHYAFSVPPHLAASGFAHTPILTFLHMSAPTSTILLHQAAEEQASAHGITPSSLLESQALRLAAAEMVASTMQLAGHTDVRLLHPFTGSCLCTAARVLMRALTVRADDGRQRSLRVLLDAMGQLQAANTLTGGYYKDLDAEFPGMRRALYAQARADTPSSTAGSYTPPLPTPSELPLSAYALNPPPPPPTDPDAYAAAAAAAVQHTDDDAILYYSDRDFSDPDFFGP